MSLSHVHRIGTELMRALVTQHETFATFLSEPLDGLQRWQSACSALVEWGCDSAAEQYCCPHPLAVFMILITVVCSQLLVNIWMYYAKAVNCAVLTCCRGSTGF